MAKPHPNRNRLANGSALAVGVGAAAGPLVAIGATHQVVRASRTPRVKPPKPPHKPRGHSQAVTPAAADQVYPTAAANTSAPQSYAGGSAGASGYGSDYGPPPTPLNYAGSADAADQGDTSGGSDQGKPAKSKPLIGPRTKVVLIVVGSVVGVTALYGYVKYRQLTYPIRKFKQIRNAARGLIGAVKS